MSKEYAIKTYYGIIMYTRGEGELKILIFVHTFLMDGPKLISLLSFCICLPPLNQ